MTWAPEMEELERKRELAKRMGGAEGIERQHGQGRLTVRERIDRLLDAESFAEVGTHNGAASYDDDDRLVSYRPGSSVRGYGSIDGRSVIVVGDDFTIRGGPPTARSAVEGGSSPTSSRSWAYR